MNYITFNEIIEVNGLLEEKGLNFKVHLRDACGKQSCWIEPLGNCACEGRYEEMYQVVEEYFRRKGQKITFDETKLNFLLFNTVLWLTPVHDTEFNSGIVTCVWPKSCGGSLTFRLFLYTSGITAVMVPLLNHYSMRYPRNDRFM